MPDDAERTVQADIAGGNPQGFVPPDAAPSIEELGERLADLCTQTAAGLAAYLFTARDPVALPGTSAQARCHILRCDGHGVPRANGLAGLLGRKVIDYAIPRNLVQQAKDELQRTGSTAGFVGLADKAKGLFTDIARTGEGGELLLYLLAEAYLGIPQVVSKMHLKTNPRVHYHGVDGIHASVDSDTGVLALWWGESKLYASLSAGLNACLSSIAKYLVPDAPSGSPVERDLDLLQAYAELDDPALIRAFKQFLNPDDPLFNRVQYRGICLVGFDVEDYPVPEEEMPVRFSEEIENAMDDWNTELGTAIGTHELTRSVLEVFFVPFPSVEAIRSAFLKTLGYGS